MTAWLLVSVLSVVAFVVPTDTVEAVTTLRVVPNTTVGTSETNVLGDSVATLLARFAAVLLLVSATSIPCESDYTSRILSCLSLFVATVFWSVLLSDNEGALVKQWFGILFLAFGLCVPLVSLAVDVLQRSPPFRLV